MGTGKGFFISSSRAVPAITDLKVGPLLSDFFETALDALKARQRASRVDEKEGVGGGYA